MISRDFYRLAYRQLGERIFPPISGLLRQPSRQGKAMGPAACNLQTISFLDGLNGFYAGFSSGLLGPLQKGGAFMLRHKNKIQLRVACFSRPVQERAEYPQITADGVVRQPALTHGNDHIVQIFLCECGERGGEIQVLLEGMKMRIVVLNGLVADTFCGLRRDEAFKNLRDSLIVRLSIVFWTSKTDTLPFVKWAKRQGVLIFTGYNKKPRKRSVFKGFCFQNTMDQWFIFQGSYRHLQNFRRFQSDSSRPD